MLDLISSPSAPSTPALASPAPKSSPAACASPMCSPIICEFCKSPICEPCEAKTPAPTASLLSLPNEVLELIAESCGSDLGRFASVSRGIHGLVTPTRWRHAYQARFSDDVEEEWGDDALPPSMWRSCLLRDAGKPKAM